MSVRELEGHWRPARPEGIDRPRLAAGPVSGKAISDHPAIDIAWPMAVVLAMLFTPQLKSLTPMIVAGMVPLILYLRHDRVPMLLSAGLPVLLLPLLALTSAAWSIAPGATLYYGSLYMITVLAGMIIGGLLRPREAMIGIFLAFAIYSTSSFFLGQTVAWGGGALGNAAFAGLAQGKNSSGDTAAIGLLASLGAIAVAVSRRSMVLGLLAAIVIAIQVWTLINARSTGALVAGGGAALCMILWLISQRLPYAGRGMIFVTVALTALGAAATQRVWFEPLYDAVLQVSGKDSTLTGRTYIWARAEDVMEGHRVLGVGYSAFWRHGNLDAEGLWRYAGISNRSGFNFHNTPIELLVHFGYVGLLLFMAVAMGLVLLLFWRALVRPQPLAIFFCAFVTYESLRLMFESVGLGTMHQTTALIMAAFAFAVRRTASMPPAEIAAAVEPAVWRSR